MTYEYTCSNLGCELQFDVTKVMSEMDRPEVCPRCEATATRAFAPSRVYFSGTKVQEAEYNPGLGCIVRNKQHRAELCKIKGVEEIGNEKPETLHKHYEAARKDKWEKSWAQADKGWVGDG